MLKLTTKGLGRLLKIIGEFQDAQQWLDEKYSTPESKLAVDKLIINDKDLTGPLSLREFANLIEFRSNEILKSLSLDCPKLKVVKCRLLDEIKIDCSNLEELDVQVITSNLGFLEQLNPSKIKKISLLTNHSNRDLSIFARFINLEKLDIGYCQEAVFIKRFNHFYGSLAPLKNLTKLRELHIDCTDVDSGLEYLPESLEIFTYSLGDEYGTKKVTKVVKIIEQLAPYNGDWKKWQKANISLVIKTNPEWTLQKIQELEDKQAELSNKLNNSDTIDQIMIEKLQKELNELKKERDLLQTKLNEVLNQDVSLQLEVKKAELNKLKKKFKKAEHACEDLLEAVGNLSSSVHISTSNDFYWNIKEKNTWRLRESNFSEEEISNLCDLQTEITKLRVQLEDLKSNKQLLLTNSQNKQLLIEASKNYSTFTTKLFTQTKIYLIAKENFLSLRKETIEMLKGIVNLVEKETITSKGKYVIREEGSKLLTATLKIAPISTPLLNANELITESISITFNHLKIKFNEKNSAIFKNHLTKSDNVTNIIKHRDFLLEIVNKNPSFNSSLTIIELFNLNDSERIFTEEYEIYKVTTNIWQSKCIITVDDMKSSISDLVKNFLILERELEQENKEISKLNGEMINLESHRQSFSLEEQLMICSIEDKSQDLISRSNTTYFDAEEF